MGAMASALPRVAFPGSFLQPAGHEIGGRAELKNKGARVRPVGSHERYIWWVIDPATGRPGAPAPVHPLAADRRGVTRIGEVFSSRHADADSILPRSLNVVIDDQ